MGATDCQQMPTHTVRSKAWITGYMAQALYDTTTRTDIGLCAGNNAHTPAAGGRSAFRSYFAHNVRGATLRPLSATGRTAVGANGNRREATGRRCGYRMLEVSRYISGTWGIWRGSRPASTAFPGGRALEHTDLGMNQRYVGRRA